MLGSKSHLSMVALVGPMVQVQLDEMEVDSSDASSYSYKQILHKNYKIMEHFEVRGLDTLKRIQKW